MDGDKCVRFFDAHPRHLRVLQQLKVQPDCGARLRSRAGKLGIALAGVHIAQIKTRASMVHRQINFVAHCHIADVQIAAPFTLPVKAGAHLAVRRRAERAHKWRHRPRDAVVKMHRAIAHRAAGARRMPQNFSGVVCGKLRPARGLTQRPALRPNRNPRVVRHQNVFNVDHERVAALRALHKHRAAHRVGHNRRAVEARALAGDCLVRFGLKVSRRCIPRLDFKRLAWADPKLRLFAPVERKFLGFVARYKLHGGTSS